MFRESKSFDFELQTVCWFIAISDLVKNENERLFVACSKNEENERRFSASFKFVDF